MILETIRKSGIRAGARKILSAMKMLYSPLVFGKRTNEGVGSYFDLITDEGRLFYGDSFHFGYFNNGTETLEEALGAHTDLVFEMARLQSSTKVLDIGCGIGAPAIRLVGQYEAHVTGVNISQEQVRQGRALVEQKGLSGRIDIQNGNALELQFDKNSFDSILCLEVAGDICVSEKQKGDFAQEVYRVLKSGGSVGFSDLIFTSLPTAAEDKTLKTVLYHEGKELISDWPEIFRNAGFLIEDEREIIKETMKTWFHTLKVYEDNLAVVNKRYGKNRAAKTMEQLRQIPDILEKYAAFPVLSLWKQ